MYLLCFNILTGSLSCKTPLSSKAANNTSSTSNLTDPPAVGLDPGNTPTSRRTPVKSTMEKRGISTPDSVRKTRGQACLDYVQQVESCFYACQRLRHE